MQPKVTVCVPIYNTAKYIGQCARSLFSQTLEEMEYLFINDCTLDDSIEILENVLEEFPQRKQQVRIINNKYNQGHFKVFKTLFSNASGEYVISCDSDDWVETTMYKKLYNEAKAKNADMVLCNYWTEWENRSEKKNLNFEGTKEERIRACLQGKYGFYSWVTLVKRDIYKKIEFVDCGYIEDTIRFCQVLIYSQKYAYVSEPLYHYRRQGQGITSIAKVELIKKLDYVCNNWISNFIHKEYGNKYDHDLLIRKLKAKSVWFYQSVPTEFYEWWPESNKPTLLKELHLPMSKKVILRLAMYKQRRICNLIIKLYRLLQK